MIVVSSRRRTREVSTQKGTLPPQAEINSRHTAPNSLTFKDHELRDSLNSTSKASA